MSITSVLKNKYFRLAATVIALVCSLIAIITLLLLSPKNIYEGIKVEGVDVSGLSINEAAIKLEDAINNYLDGKSIVLRYNNLLWTVKPKDISLDYKTDKAVNEAFRAGREGNVLERLITVVNIRLKGKDLSLEPSYDKTSLKRILGNIKKKLDKEGTDAYITYEKGVIEAHKEKIGKQFNVDNNIKLIENHIMQEKFGVVDLDVTEKKPAVLFDDIKDINTVLSVFSTVFNPKDSNRTQNLKLSCDKINGLILMPNEVFSMNETLGPRTVENGYKEAKIIIKSEYVNGVGGGVCQITTTLYDAVLLSRLKIVERSHHSLPSIYVGPGQDATIAENYLDFKFKNDRDYPIFISASLVRNKVTVKILGKENYEDYKVKLVPVVIEEYPPDEDEIIIDDTIPDGEEVIAQHPKNGCRVILYRELYNSDGELVEREKISDDVYKPIKAQLKVNSNHEKAKNSFVINDSNW
jgi:vancomycin resistance protein YoaR